MRERSWGALVARNLIQTERRPDEDDLTLYQRLIEETLDNVVVVEDRIERERVELEQLVQVVQGLLELEGELAQQRIAAANAMLDAEKARRRLGREARNAETRARRAIEVGNRAGVISRRVVVDPEAWAFLASEARHRRTTLMALVGQVLAAEVAAFEAGVGSGSPLTPRRRSPGEGRARPADRVVRLLLGVDSWDSIVRAAATAEMSAGRYAGEALELVAYAEGWRAVDPPVVR